MQRLLCVAALIAIVNSALPVSCDYPDINVFSSGNVTFSKAGVLRFIQGTCTLRGGAPQITNLEPGRFNLTEGVPTNFGNPTVYLANSPQESLLEWRPLTPVQSLYTAILIDVSGTQASSLSDVATILQLSILPALKNVHGETMVATFDGSNIYWVKNFTTDHEDALKTVINQLKGYTIKDNSTNLWSAIDRAQTALLDRLSQVQLLDSSLNSEYAHGSLVLISNGRDTCGCFPTNNLRTNSLVSALSIAIGDDIDNATMTSWYGNNRYNYLDFNARRDQTERNSLISIIFNNINQTIGYNAQGFVALRYCSPRRGSPLADTSKTFKFQVSYNGVSIATDSYNATTFGPGCTLSSAVSTRAVTVLLFVALFFLSF